MNENITPLPVVLPLRFERGEFNGGHDDDALGSIVTDDDLYIATVEETYNCADAEQTAEYLVTAANAYPALTARVKELEEALGDCVGMLRGFTSSEHDEEGAVTQQIKDADAALNKEPTHESRCTCNDAPPIHKISGESFDDEAMRHYENLDHYREHCPLHGRFVNKEPTT